MSGRHPWARCGGRTFGTVRAGREQWPPVLDGPAVRRLVRALEAGVEGPELVERFGRNGDDLRALAREHGWDGRSRDVEALLAPVETYRVPRGLRRRGDEDDMEDR